VEKKLSGVSVGSIHHIFVRFFNAFLQKMRKMSGRNCLSGIGDRGLAETRIENRQTTSTEHMHCACEKKISATAGKKLVTCSRASAPTTGLSAS